MKLVTETEYTYIMKSTQEWVDNHPKFKNHEVAARLAAAEFMMNTVGKTIFVDLADAEEFTS